ncbi:MAG: Mut7-C RNAse domain-containing protein [Smithella sp.]
MSEDPKYLADGTLSKLAKWLRLVGYDTIVYSYEAGRNLLNLAASEKRIVLTRRRDMLKRQFSGQLYFVKGTDVGSQLQEVIAEYSLILQKEKMFSICLKCNERLEPVEKEEVYNLVPPYVFANCHAFHKCPRCRRIFWEGTHRRNSLQFLKELSIYQNEKSLHT